MVRKSYAGPTQVVFADPGNPGQWLTGIAYKDEIICGCCGGVIKISEITKKASDNNVDNAIYEYDYWEELTDTIVGGELPEGLTRTGYGDIVEESKVEDDEFDDDFIEWASQSFFD